MAILKINLKDLELMFRVGTILSSGVAFIRPSGRSVRVRIM